MLICCVIVYLTFSLYAKKTIREEQTEKLLQLNNATYTTVQQRLKYSQNKVQFLHATPPVSGLGRSMLHHGIDPIDGTTTTQWTARLQVIFSAFIQSNPEIGQIRFIGAENNGKELVRVERKAGGINVTPKALLQAKGNTDYFKAISTLKPTESYISDITLNREYGVIETPMWPTFRVAKPVFNENLTFIGFIIINIDASQFLAELQKNLKNSLMSLYIVNSDGYFIEAPKKSLLFGFDLDRPEATWQHLTTNAEIPAFDEVTNIVFDEVEHLMIANQFHLSHHENRSLYFIHAITNSSLQMLWESQRNVLIYLIIFIFLIIISIIYGYQYYLNKLISLYDDQSQYEAIISGSSDAIINIDKQGNILNWNESATFLFGISESDAIRKRISDIIMPISPNDNRLSESVLQKIISSKASLALEIDILSSANIQQTLSISLSPVIPKNSSTPSTVAALIRDITESKITQQKIVALNNSLEQQVIERTKQLELATKEATTANKTKSAFVANISHEIRTPLNGIGGMLELLSRESVSAKQHSYLSMAKNSVSTLTILINDLLDLTKIESGKLDIEIEPFNLIDSVSATVETMSLRADEKGLAIYLDCTNVQCENLISAPYRLKQILNNLLGNAVKFTEKGHVIIKVSSHLSTVNNKAIVDISITDTGIGITRKQQEKLFKPFSQADASIAKNFGGTGLGLSISKQLANLLGGDITVMSTIDQGSTFSISLEVDIDLDGISRTLGPLLLGKNFHLYVADHIEKNILYSQLHAWKAEVSSSSTIEDLYATSADIQADVFIIQHDLLDDNFEHWYVEQCKQKKCYLLLLTNRNIDNTINIKESENCLHLNRPILPLQFLRAYHMLGQPITNNSQIKKAYLPETTQQEQDKKYNVLVVDDNEINRYVTQGLLEKYPINLYSAKNGAEAVAFLKKIKHFNDIQLVLMDCQMPIMNGYEATKMIRRGDAGQIVENIPIIAMTADAMAGDRDTCIQAGMNDFIAKPIVPALFEKKVMQWLTSSKKI